MYASLKLFNTHGFDTIISYAFKGESLETWQEYFKITFHSKKKNRNIVHKEAESQFQHKANVYGLSNVIYFTLVIGHVSFMLLLNKNCISINIVCVYKIQEILLILKIYLLFYATSNFSLFIFG